LLQLPGASMVVAQSRWAMMKCG